MNKKNFIKKTKRKNSREFKRSEYDFLLDKQVYLKTVKIVSNTLKNQFLKGDTNNEEVRKQF